MSPIRQIEWEIAKGKVIENQKPENRLKSLQEKEKILQVQSRIHKLNKGMQVNQQFGPDMKSVLG